MTPSSGSFEAPGMIGQLTTEQRPPRLVDRFCGSQPTTCTAPSDESSPTAAQCMARPNSMVVSDGLSRSTTRPATESALWYPLAAAQSQTMIAVRDVEASSRWYQQLLGLRSDHGGPEYERLLSGGTLVLQLHHRDVEHHHGLFVNPDVEVGNGVLLWFGEVPDFDDVVVRAEQLEAPIVRAPHRNPPEGEGNGPGHREIWIKDPDGYTVVVASPDGEAYEPAEMA